jgi:hypothetical protein
MERGFIYPVINEKSTNDFNREVMSWKDHLVNDDPVGVLQGKWNTFY